MSPSFSRRIIALAATTLMLLTSATSSADEMVIRGKPICIGNSLETLVKHAGRPLDISFERDCAGKDCIPHVPVERWIYLHEGIRYRVDVFHNRVISIERESAGIWSQASISGGA